MTHISIAQVSYHSKTIIATQMVAPKHSRLKSLNLFTSFLNIRLQKELGRYLFPVFLEKRESERHSKKYPP